MTAEDAEDANEVSSLGFSWLVSVDEAANAVAKMNDGEVDRATDGHTAQLQIRHPVLLCVLCGELSGKQVQSRT